MGDGLEGIWSTLRIQHAAESRILEIICDSVLSLTLYIINLSIPSPENGPNLTTSYHSHSHYYSLNDFHYSLQYLNSNIFSL